MPDQQVWYPDVPKEDSPSSPTAWESHDDGPIEGESPVWDPDDGNPADEEDTNP